MKNKGILLIVLALAGCVPSWNPFCTDGDLVSDPELVGIWRPVTAREGSQEIWVFSKAGEKLYQLLQVDEEGRQALFEARLFQLDGQRFLDLYLTRLEGGGPNVNLWAGLSLLPAHLLLRVEQIEPNLKLAVMNPDWLRKFLKKTPEAIAHRIVADGNIVLVAGTGELQKFILAHLNEQDFFGGPMEMKRQ